MGSAIKLSTVIPAAEILPRAEETVLPIDSHYGIAVGGDTDGIYGDGSASTDDSTRATNSAGQGVVIVTQGRCLARIEGQANTGNDIVVGDPLTTDSLGRLTLANPTLVGDFIIARALQPYAKSSDGTPVDDAIIAVDVQREGIDTDTIS